jgi:hypothetical protein
MEEAGPGSVESWAQSEAISKEGRQVVKRLLRMVGEPWSTPGCV